MASSSSLSSVVNNLVRASMGTTIPSTVSDDDLDRAVKELLVKEAKKRAEKYGQQGIRAYLSSGLSESNAPRTNKRFLSSIIKSTDDHNKTILRAQAQAAEEVKREREEIERRERRARAEEAAAAERMRRGSKRKVRDSESWDHWDGRTADRKRSRRTRSRDDKDEHEEEDDYERRRRHRSRSRSRDRDRDSSRRHHRDRDSRRSHRHHRSRSPIRKDGRSSRRRSASRDARSDGGDPLRRHSRRHRSQRASSSRSRSRTRSDSEEHTSSSKKLYRRSEETVHSREDELRSKLASRRDKESSRRKSPSPPPPPSPRRSRTSSPMSVSRSPTPGPGPDVSLPSKMDKYFEESYDPRLDVAPLSAPKVPSTGLINNAEFEGWDAMLELIRQRREDKEEKRRLQKMGLSKDEIKKSLSAGSVISSSGAADRWSGGSTSIMDIEYKKRGSVREWDMGKEGF